MQSNRSSNTTKTMNDKETSEDNMVQDDPVDESGVVSGINMLFDKADESNSNNNNENDASQSGPNEAPASSSNNPVKTNPTSSIASSNSGSVTFALPAVAAPPTRSYGSANSSGSLSSSGGEQRQRPALRNGTLTTGSLKMTSMSSNVNRISSNTSSNTISAGSGSEPTNNLVTSSGGTNNSSGSGSDGGSQNRRSGGEASLEYYYAGYGSGSLATDGSQRATIVNDGNEANNGANLPSFASFRASSLAAAELNLHANNEGTLPPEGMTHHVLVAANDGNPPNFTSHLRHHRSSRRTNVTTTTAGNNVPPVANEANGIPSTIGTDRRSVRLVPQENERHVTVMAPFPPDNWSSTSSTSGGRSERKRPASNSTTRTAAAAAATANAAAKSAVHVSTDDPILKPSLFTQKKVAIQTLEDSKPAAAASSSNDSSPPSSTKNHKRKAFLLSPPSRFDDSSDGVRSDTGEVGSGSEEGYEASSSSNAERQSGSSGSDSVSSSDDAKKKVLKSNRNSTATATAANSKTGSMESKRTETSSMSSSVLADFSSGVNEELNYLSSENSISNNSSCVSLNELETEKKKVDGTGTGGGHGAEPMEVEPSSSSRNHRKRPHHETERKETDIDMSAPDTTMKSGLALMEKSLQQKVRSTHHYHSRSTGRKMLEESFLSAKRDLSSGSSPEDAKAVTASALDSTTSSVSASGSATMLSKEKMGTIVTHSAHRQRMELVSSQDTLIYSLGPDVMALVVSFLEVPESHAFLTSPLSKTWLEAYTVPQELWKILCTSKPFYAKLEESPDKNSDISTCSFPLCNDLEIRHLFGRYRLLYSSFVRCVKYLDRLRDDAINGRTPSGYNESNRQDNLHPYNRNGSLKAYFARARRLVRRNRRAGSPSSSSASGSLTTDSGEEQKTGENKPSGEVAATSSGSENSNGSQRNPQSRLGRSMLTERLLRPTRTGDVDNVNLPWSCAIYSVVNWMVAFVDVEGIQVCCSIMDDFCF